MCLVPRRLILLRVVCAWFPDGVSQEESAAAVKRCWKLLEDIEEKHRKGILSCDADWGWTRGGTVRH